MKLCFNGVGIAMMATMYVRNELAAGHPLRAKRATYLSISLGVLCFCITLLNEYVQSILIHIVNSDPQYKR